MPADTLSVLASLVGRKLLSAGTQLATAESCTGGGIAQAVTAIAGSSAWFDRGFVTYSNAAKVELLGVSAETLDRAGAVSEATAAEMVRGALARSRAGIAVAVTGIAGPGGGSVDKPVGMVCFGWVRSGGTARTETRCLPGDREQVRRQSVIRALQGLIEVLDDASDEE